MTGAPPHDARVTHPVGDRTSSLVHYAWVRSAGTSTPTQSIVLNGTERRTLKDVWTIDHAVTQGYDKLVTDVPYPGSAKSETFDVECHKAAP